MTRSAEFVGKTVLITGGATGIGSAIAATFIKSGARVLINHLPQGPLPDTAQIANGAVAIPADISRLEDIEKLFQIVRQHAVNLDILINNAGIFPRADPLDLDECIWDQTLNTNLKGAFFCAQKAACWMRQNSGGRIINILSDAAYNGSVRGVAYAASKAGLLAVTRSLARALARDCILVNAIAPGITDTEQPSLSDADRQRYAQIIPLGRIGQPADIAQAAFFLASEASAYMTGQTLHVNGGRMMVS